MNSLKHTLAGIFMIAGAGGAVAQGSTRFTDYRSDCVAISTTSEGVKTNYRFALEYRANDVWQLMDVKYAGTLPPELDQTLMECLDRNALCARQYRDQTLHLAWLDRARVKLDTVTQEYAGHIRNKEDPRKMTVTEGLCYTRVMR